MTKRLDISGEEAYRLAHAIAEETGRPIAEVIVAALREHASRLPWRDGTTTLQRATYEELRALSRETAKTRKPGATSEHDDMDDEFGLPK